MPACVPRSFKESQALYHAELDRLADQAFGMYLHNPCRRLYLFGTMRAFNFASGYAALHIAGDDCLDEPVIQQAVPISLTRDGMRQWLKERLGRTPLWCFCD